MRPYARALLLAAAVLTVLELLAHGALTAPAIALDSAAATLVVVGWLGTGPMRGRLYLPESWAPATVADGPDAWAEDDLDLDLDAELDTDAESELEIDWSRFEREFEAYARSGR